MVTTAIAAIQSSTFFQVAITVIVSRFLTAAALDLFPDWVEPDALCACGLSGKLFLQAQQAKTQGHEQSAGNAVENGHAPWRSEQMLKPVRE